MERNGHSFWLARIVLWASAIGTAAYWIAYLNGLRLSEVSECASQLQFGQIPSNFWIVISASLGAIGLGRKRRWGLLMTVAAASSGLYIGLFDITLNLRTDVYLLPLGEIAPELFANTVCTVLPAYLFYVALRAPGWT